MTASTVAAIHESPRQGALAVTGGGSALLSSLLSVPGASATVLEATIPYASQSLADYLGMAPAQWCSAETARTLAMRAFSRALALGGDFGFAITASLATNRPKRGAHRAYLAFQDARSTRVWTLALSKGAHSRDEEERLVTEAGLGALAFALDLAAAPGMPVEEAFGNRPLAELMRGERRAVSPGRFDAVLPGAFNPLHDGHRAMRAHAVERLGCDVAYELSIANVDKPALDYLDLNPRLAQFAGDEIVLTDAPTFVAKARALGGGIAFVVGADTITRIAEPRYYGGAVARDTALAEMAAAGCRFLVFGRVDTDGAFKTLADMTLPPALVALCEGVSERAFRNDLSSTALRQT